MLSDAQPLPHGLPFPWVREYDETSRTWVFVNPTTTPITISHTHPGFLGQSASYSVVGAEVDMDIFAALESEPSSPSTSCSSSLYREHDVLASIAPVAPRRRTPLTVSAVAMLEKMEEFGQYKDRWIRLSRDRGHHEARSILVRMKSSISVEHVDDGDDAAISARRRRAGSEDSNASTESSEDGAEQLKGRPRLAWLRRLSNEGRRGSTGCASSRGGSMRR